MAVGPTLGTGLFIGAGQALAVGGPASLLISYVFLSLLTYLMTTTVAEVAAHSPARHGTLVMNAFRYTSRLGFAAAMLRWYTMAMFVPYEITTAMVNLGLWNPGSPIAIRLAIITTIIVGSNYLPEGVFKRTERLFTKIKIGTMISLLVLSLSIGLGGATGHDKWGFQYWRKPGAMHEYLAKGSLGKFWGLLQCLLNGAVAFTFAPEMIVHRIETPETPSNSEIAEDLDPSIQSRIPRTVTIDVVTTAVPYIQSSLAMGVMAPYNDPLLTNNGAGAGLSPFVIGLNTARVRIVPVMATIAIFLSSVASGRSFLYQASRSLCALSELGHAPRMFNVRSNWGVPYMAVTASSLFALLAFVSTRISSSVVLTYFLLFITSSGYLSWLVSFAIFRRFRRQTRVRGVPRRRFRIQPAAAYLGSMLSVALLVANGMTGALAGPRAGPRGGRIMAAYLSPVVFAVLYFVHGLGGVTPNVTPRGSRDDTGHLPGPSHGPQHRRGQGNPQQPTSSAIEMEQVWSAAMDT